MLLVERSMWKYELVPSLLLPFITHRQPGELFMIAPTWLFKARNASFAGAYPYHTTIGNSALARPRANSLRDLLKSPANQVILAAGRA